MSVDNVFNQIEQHKDKLAYWAAWQQGLITREQYIVKMKEILNVNIFTTSDER